MSRGAPDADLLVVGGGPVGLVAAIEARRAGLSVVVAESRAGVIDKACGEGLMPAAVPHLGRLGVRPHGMALRGIRYTDGRRTVDHRFTGAVGLGVRRTALHGALAARAEELGVRVEALRAERIEQDDDTVTVAARAGAGLRARWMIGADGLHSTVARSLGLARPGRTWRRFGLRRHVRIEPWSDLVEVYWTPAGELYVTPVDDRLVGIAALVPRGGSLGAVLAGAPEVAERIRDAAEGSELAGAGPFRHGVRSVVQGRILLAGDAAGYIDAITGEGLRIGFAQAAAAVGRIYSGNPEAYARDVRELGRAGRRLTGAMTLAASTPLRRAVVPAAARLPRVFARAVELLAE